MVDFSNVGVSENGGFSPQIIHFNRNFHYKSWILGAHPYFWKHLYVIFVFRAVFVTMFLVSRTSEVKMPMSSLWIDIILIERAAWLTSIQKMTLVFCIAGNFLCPGKSGWEPRGAGRFFWGLSHVIFLYSKEERFGHFQTLRREFFKPSPFPTVQQDNGHLPESVDFFLKETLVLIIRSYNDFWGEKLSHWNLKKIG